MNACTEPRVCVHETGAFVQLINVQSISNILAAESSQNYPFTSLEESQTHNFPPTNILVLIGRTHSGNLLTSAARTTCS